MTKTLIFGAIVSTLFISSCKQEGCTDATATNYESAAEENNGSCIYEAKVQFWYDDMVSQGFTGAGVETLIFYFEGSLVGSAPVDTPYAEAPDCDSGNPAQFMIELGKNKAKIGTYVVKDQDNNELWSEQVNIFATECTTIQLGM